MIFKNRSDSALLLAAKIKLENLSDFLLTYINSDTESFCQIVADHLQAKLHYLPPIIATFKPPKNLFILDDGSTSSQEYNEYTDKIRKIAPQTQIIFAIPFIPQSEESSFKSNCDSLLTLHVEPLFFSVDQFYQDHD